MNESAAIAIAGQVPLRVLVADPSAVVRTAVKRMLESDDGVQVVGTAQDAQQVLARAAALHPDVIALDIALSRTGRVTTLREILRCCSCPVVILSESNSEAAEETLQALDGGAFDYAPKQFIGEPREMARLRYELVSKVKAAVRATRQRAKPDAAVVPRTLERHPLRIPAPRVICIGSSTAGPRALQEILPTLPADLPAGVLLVQHMPNGFTAPFARRLNSLCAMEVREARPDDVVEPGTILVAPAGWHMSVHRRSASSFTVQLNRSPENLLHRPSVDVLMTSAAEAFHESCMGVILTGMGADGGRGMKAIYERGGMTVGQDEASCAVYGMPRTCAELGVLRRSVPLSAINDEILAAARYLHTAP